MSYTVRDYDNNAPEDHARLAAMFNSFDSVWPGGFTRGVPETPENMRRRGEERDRLAVLIVEHGDGFAGYCDLKVDKGETEVAYIPLLGAHPDHHSKGVGKMLLREMIRRVTAQGFRELSLGTWGGNLKAVPLYKKTGFQWVPETQVYMRNFIPSCLNHPVGRTFFADRDWYQVFERTLELAPDDVRWKGMKVFVYRFCDGDDFVQFTFDATSGGLTALETADYTVACYLPVEEVAAGETAPFTWEITPKRGQSLDVLLITEADAGLELKLMERLTVDQETTITRDLKVPADTRPNRYGEKPRRVRTTLLIDGQPVSLETGVNVVRPIEIEYSGQELYVGREQRIEVTLRSLLDRTVSGTLAFDPQPGLDCPQPVQTFVLPPRMKTRCEFTVTAREPGALPTALRLLAGSVRRTHPIVFRGLDGSGPVASLESEIAKQAVLEVPGLRIEGGEHGGWLQLRNTELSEGIGGGYMPEPGPPFVDWREKPLTCPARFETRSGATWLVQSMSVPEFPHLIIERAATLIGSSLAHHRYRVINTGTHPQTVQLRMTFYPHQGEFVSVPYAEGIVREPTTDWENFPSGQNDLIAPERQPTESWIAREGKEAAFGLIWKGTPEIEHQWGVQMRYDLGEIPAGGVVEVPDVYLFGGRGNGETVRRWWRQLVQPSEVRERHKPETHRALDIGFSPSPALLMADTTDTILRLQNRRGREQSGELKITGNLFRTEPAGFTVEGARWDREATCPVRLLAPAHPAAELLSVSLEVPTSVLPFTVPAIRVGAGDHLSVQEAEPGLFAIANGLMTLRVAPAFLGSVVALEKDGVNHLLSAYPKSGPFVWANPWFGGIHPLLGWMADDRLTRETFHGEPVVRNGERGLGWQGVRVVCQPEHKDLRWFGIEVEYLTLPGSNLIALVTRWTNRTDARSWIPDGGGIAVWSQPGGSREHSVMHWQKDGERRYRRPGGFPINAQSKDWVAVENPGTGDALLLIPAEPEAQVTVQNFGDGGPHLSVSGNIELEPGETREILSWLVLTNDLTQAEAYASLSKVRRLP